MNLEISHQPVGEKPECSTWHKFSNPGGASSTKKCPISNPGGTILTKNVLFPTQARGPVCKTSQILPPTLKSCLWNPEKSVVSALTVILNNPLFLH